MNKTPFNITQINKIKTRLVQKKETVAVAESVTTGLLQFALALADEATNYFQGGITTYNLGQKTMHLSVEPIQALACNCVSAPVAKQMALNVCNLFKSNWGVGITGYASPVPESDQKLFCYYAIAHNGKIVAAHRLTGKANNAYEVQVDYINKVLGDFVKVCS
ncbi:MAG: CinA family protein [Bacteroidota bacterium]